MPTQQNSVTTLKSTEPRRPTVAVVACEGFAPFQLSTALAIFGASVSGLQLFDTRVCGVEGRTLRSEHGMALDASFGIEGLAHADVIVFPFWRSPGERPPHDLLKALRAAHMRHVTIMGLCLGGYVLAYAGLLDHRSASTHPELIEDFRARFPRVTLDSDAPYVEADNLVTSAGMGAGIDCCMHVVQSLYGSQIASQLAQHLAVPLHLHGAATKAPRPLAPDSADVAGIQNALAFVADNLAAQHTVDALAARACMSRRSFTRHFNKATRMSVGRWVLLQRLNQAQRMLETTNHRVESIAYLAGFPSAVSFRRHFRAEFGACPIAWRRARSPDPGATGPQRQLALLPISAAAH